MVVVESSKIVWRVGFILMFIVPVSAQTVLQVKKICKEEKASRKVKVLDMQFALSHG